MSPDNLPPDAYLRMFSARDPRIVYDKTALKFPDAMGSAMYASLAHHTVEEKRALVQDVLGFPVDMTANWLGLAEDPRWHEKQRTHGWALEPGRSATWYSLDSGLRGLAMVACLNEFTPQGGSVTHRHTLISSGPTLNHCYLEIILITICKVYGF